MLDTATWSFLPDLVTLSRCRRRSSVATTQKKAEPYKFVRRGTDPGAESDGVGTTTDIGDVTRTDRSDGSEHITSCTDGSDTDSFFVKRLNPKAPTFVPATAASGSTAHVDSQTIRALQESINTLSPQGAAMMRAYLESQDTEKKVQVELATDAVNFSNASNATEKWPSSSQLFSNMPRHRAFMPFRGYSGKNQQTRPSQGATSSDGIIGVAESLRSHLRELASIDSARVLMIRKVGGLGGDTGGLLQTHFEKFGKVDRVMISHTRSKTDSGHTRMRMATTCFLVMSTADEAAAALKHGETHILQGVSILVSKFESHPIKDGTGES